VALSTGFGLGKVVINGGKSKLWIAKIFSCRSRCTNVASSLVSVKRWHFVSVAEIKVVSVSSNCLSGVAFNSSQSVVSFNLARVASKALRRLQLAAHRCFSSLNCLVPHGDHQSSQAGGFADLSVESRTVNRIHLGFASVIVVNFPALFAGLSGNHLTVLWRGSRDGFGARLSRPLRRPGVHSDIELGQGNGEQFQGFTLVK
jgi:hypothetical protein